MVGNARSSWAVVGFAAGAVVASGLLIVGGLWVLGDDREPGSGVSDSLEVGAVTTTSGQGAVDPTPATEAEPTTLLVWLEPGTPVDDATAVGVWLKTHASLSSWSFQDEVQMWITLIRTHADPTALSASLEPADLPTFYRVRTTDPGSITETSLSEFAFVSEVERASDDDLEAMAAGELPSWPGWFQLPAT